jgi:alanyl-tRNA synthetase
MTSEQIRNQFFKFFKEKRHKVVQSAPVVPFDDPTLLFVNAGMNQFKDVFLGKGERNYTRAADTQKCIRVSGKHNDLEEVGYDTYHHTFFEMLGNWSFGDYYKEEAIMWAWELLTEVWRLPKERLWATIYTNDDEAHEIWKSKTDIDPKHILRFGEKDNFWEMGDIGPCGPCSEIHINLGNDFNNPKYVNAGVAECIELWNLVFIQYDRDETGKLNNLPQKHVDTGMGFERMCAVLQNKQSNYETDVFTPIIDRIVKISGIKNETEENKIPMRVISDHIRTLTFAIADGAVPGNEGRGYVLRRILRRAARYGRKLNMNEPFLYKLVDTVVKTMSSVFPEISEKKSYVKKLIKAEEESFNATLDRGIALFEEVIKILENRKEKIIPGKDVFKLYDTFGFPLDLTNVMAHEKGFAIDEDGFNKLMTGQKQKSKDATKSIVSSLGIGITDLGIEDIEGIDKTIFTGYDYDQLKLDSKILFPKDQGDYLGLVFDRTPFYVEAGGQISDSGRLLSGDQVIPVISVSNLYDRTIHLVEKHSNFNPKEGDLVSLEIDEPHRWDIMRNHTATHFLHAALRKILGSHVQQAGSYVGPDHLRFDFNHIAKVSPAELVDIEALVNDEIRRNYALQHHKSIQFDEATKMGALMFFGDKYGDTVNVIQFGDFTMEFCGGTHVQNSSEIGLFKIISESSIASGVRRIEAVTGSGIEKYINDQTLLAKTQNARIEELLDSKKKLEKDLSEYKLKDKLGQLDHILALSSHVKGIEIFKGKVTADSMDELKSFGDDIRNKMKSGIGVLVAQIGDKAGIVAVVSDDLIKENKLSAGKIVGELAKLVGGGGGGKPHLATAGGKDINRIPDAISMVEDVVKGLV